MWIVRNNALGLLVCLGTAWVVSDQKVPEWGPTVQHGDIF